MSSVFMTWKFFYQIFIFLNLQRMKNESFILTHFYTNFEQVNNGWGKFETGE